MKRREFLRLSGRSLAGMSMLTALPIPLRGGVASRQSGIVVVGAGLSGLTAAFELRRVGLDVVVLEAESRPGGRVRTLRSSFSDGLHAEAGGQTFVPIVADYAEPYLNEFGLERARPSLGSLGDVFVARGQRIVRPAQPHVTWPLNLTGRERELGLAGMRREYLAPLNAGLQGDPATWNWDELRHLDQMSLEAWMVGRGASPDAIELLNLARMDFSVLPAARHSALAVAIGEESFNRLVGTPYSIEGGNDRLVLGFAERLRDHTQYGARVHRVVRSSTGLRVEYSRAGRDYDVEASRVVCALPPWALAQISFEPELSAERRRAVANLPVSNVCRFFIQTSERFWRGQGLSGSATTDGHVAYFWESSPWLDGPRGILHGWIGARGREEFERMSTRERAAFALDQAEIAFPGLSRYAEGVETVCWGLDPVVPGHAVSIPPGQFIPSVLTLDRPEDPIHFAGTETAPVLVKGFLQGAIASGRRAAAEVLAAMN